MRETWMIALIVLGGCGVSDLCGNAVLDDGEDCDDGNVVGGDGCSASCFHERETSDCGNGTVERGEACDDGNAIAGDGCSAACGIEGLEGSVFEPSHPYFSHLSPTALPEADHDEFGSFRIKCALSHLNYDDPLVFPGRRGASHLHTYFGNTDIDYLSTIENVDNVRGATCHGGPLNHTGYWIPTVVRPTYERDEDGTFRVDDEGAPIPTGRYAVVHPMDTYWLDEEGVPLRDESGQLQNTGNNGSDIYYKRSFNIRDEITPMPFGLRMIAGNASASPREPQDLIVVSWQCHDEGGDKQATIPSCARGPEFPEIPHRVHLTVQFPPCWDGVNLDSADHRSHMAYPRYSESTGQFSCPSSHPVFLAQVSYQIYYPINEHTTGPSHDTSDWFLSSDSYPASMGAGGASAHGDWFMAWNTEVMETFTERCLNAERHCANGDLGNGFRLSSELPGEGAPGLEVRVSR